MTGNMQGMTAERPEEPKPFPCVLSYPLVGRAIPGLVFTGLVRVIQPDAPQLVEPSDWQRHTICRAALMEHLDADPRVRLFFDSLPQRLSRFRVGVKETTKTLMVEFDPDPHEQVAQFVKSDLGLPWPWLSHDLLQSFCFRMAAAETGTELQTVYDLDPAEVTAKGEKEHQGPRRSFRGTSSGSTATHSRPRRTPYGRLQREYHQYRHNPKTCKNCDDRRTVREAIKEVRRVLGDNQPCLST